MVQPCLAGSQRQFEDTPQPETLQRSHGRWAALFWLKAGPTALGCGKFGEIRARVLPTNSTPMIGIGNYAPATPGLQTGAKVHDPRLSIGYNCASPSANPGLAKRREQAIIRAIKEEAPALYEKLREERVIQ